jgi:hypothetical protein
MMPSNLNLASRSACSLATISSSSSSGTFCSALEGSIADFSSGDCFSIVGLLNEIGGEENTGSLPCVSQRTHIRN